MQVTFSLFDTQNSNKFNGKCFYRYQRIINMDDDSRVAAHISSQFFDFFQAISCHITPLTWGHINLCSELAMILMA